MLTFRRTALLLSTVVATTITVAAASSPAAADEVCYWVGTDYVCEVVDPGGPGDPGGGGGGGGSQTCYWQGSPVACWQNGWGWFNPNDGCYYIRENPQPPAGDEAWEGHAPGDGAVWRRRCFGDVTGTLVWRQNPPPGQPGAMSPAQLAARAVDRMGLTGPTIHTSASLTPGGSATVFIPLWMWTDVTPTTWGPNTLTAVGTGLSVTARAKVSKIVWAMGDVHGEQPQGKVTCTQPGTPYTTAFGVRRSPDCGYVYGLPSSVRPGGSFRITATSYWDIDWWVVGGGMTGTDTAVRTSTINITVVESQVVTS